VVRVFYLAKSESQETLHQSLAQVREKSGARRLFLYDPLAALAVRGSAAQLAVAENVIAPLRAR
jgi:hypothetical protein